MERVGVYGYRKEYGVNVKLTLNGLHFKSLAIGFGD